ncbi:hypothetical protein [Haloarcula marismortui]|uniref:Uncharacterized protein n=1 Tax=Haloarcula marismortui ATCC 33800 TaxID=662476 RepID=A0A8T8KFX7_9EURY|nr:hypothetical protein [Haloarcula sinaiiensis]QUJ71935.1 hypothetical protein KDQ40_14775 [Haloarcula sinaiiensis ATCC 33800]
MGSGSECFEVELSDGTSVEVYADRVEVVEDGEGDSEDKKEESSSSLRDRLTGKDSIRGSQEGGKPLRESSYKGDSESKIASRATKNKMIFSDVMESPELVGADSEVEAVARIGVENPGWASFVDFEADLGVDPGEVDSAADGDAGAGESRHGSTGEGSPDYSPGVDASDVGSEPGTVDGVETGASIDTGSGSVSTGSDVGSGGNSVGGGSGGDGGGGNSV